MELDNFTQKDVSETVKNKLENYKGDFTYSKYLLPFNSNYLNDYRKNLVDEILIEKKTK